MRKQAAISVEEEFSGKSLPPGLEDSLPTNLSETFDTVRAGVRHSADAYISLCTLLERLTKRNQGVAADYLRFSHALMALTETSESTYATDTNDVPLLNEGISSSAKHLTISQSLLQDEARAWDEGVLEDFKLQRDTLVSVRDLFDRRDRYARDNIPQLERRIESNEIKLAGLMGRPEGAPTKPGEQEKLEQAVRAVSQRSIPFLSPLHPLWLNIEIANSSVFLFAGQTIHCQPTRTRCSHQGVYPRRVKLLPAISVSRQQAAPRLEPRTGEVCRVAGR